MSRRFKINIPNIADFKFGKEHYSQFAEVAIANGATNISSFRDPETKRPVLTFSATRAQSIIIEQALNALNSD